MKATFSPIVARPPFSLACARISVIRILFASVFPLLHCGLPNLDFSGSCAKDYYFCEPAPVRVKRVNVYVFAKGSIRKSIVALLHRSFAVYRYVLSRSFSTIRDRMDVSISLVVVAIVLIL